MMCFFNSELMISKKKDSGEKSKKEDGRTFHIQWQVCRLLVFLHKKPLISQEFQHAMYDDSDWFRTSAPPVKISW